MKYSGNWRITEMEKWDEDYLNMEVEAFITIGPKGMGAFQFGLVSGEIDGEVVGDGEDERFEFTWEGNAECDLASGSGWLRLRDENLMVGRIKLHLGDSSGLVARRIRASDISQ